MSSSHRRIDDPRALKALAHPLRLDLLEAVNLRGPLTATQAAEIVGESPANCSWHLRQLAKYGYIEEVPGATGRQRPWRRHVDSMEWHETGEDPAHDAAARALTEVYIDREVGRIREAMSMSPPAGWVDSLIATQAVAWLTADEMNDLSDRLTDLLSETRERATDPAQRPEGARPIRLLALGVLDPRLEPPAQDGDDHAEVS